MIVNWRGATWDDPDDDAPFPAVIVLSCTGLDDFVAASANITGSGHGAAKSPLFQSIGSWILEITVFADDDEQMGERLDAIRAITARADDEFTEYPFEWTAPGATIRCAFARVVQRQIPNVWTTAERTVGVTCQIAYEATDPMIYGAEVEHDFDNDETWSFTCPGWAPSERWRWVAPGPAEYPRLTWSNGDDTAVIRYGQSQVNDGQNLVVDIQPRALITTVGGPAFNRYGFFDGGNNNVIPPPWFKILPGAQTLTYHAATGGDDGCTFRYRPAMP